MLLLWAAFAAHLRVRMGMLAMLSEYDHLDIGRCVMLALVHDVSKLLVML